METSTATIAQVALVKVLDGLMSFRSACVSSEVAFAPAVSESSVQPDFWVTAPVAAFSVAAQIMFPVRVRKGIGAVAVPLVALLVAFCSKPFAGSQPWNSSIEQYT